MLLCYLAWNLSKSHEYEHILLLPLTSAFADVQCFISQRLREHYSFRSWLHLINSYIIKRSHWQLKCYLHSWWLSRRSYNALRLKGVNPGRNCSCCSSVPWPQSKIQDKDTGKTYIFVYICVQFKLMVTSPAWCLTLQFSHWYEVVNIRLSDRNVTVVMTLRMWQIYGSFQSHPGC